MCRARLYTNYHTSEEKDHKHGKRSHIYNSAGWEDGLYPDIAAEYYDCD